MTCDDRSVVEPGQYVILKLPSGILKPIEVSLNSTISIGKFGSFSSNSIIGRPYYLTFDILDKEPTKPHPSLRVVPASELNSEALKEDEVSLDSPNNENDATESFDIVGDDGEVIMRNNRLTVDDPTRQALTFHEIEQLKKSGTGSGKEIIAKIMAAHSAIGEKTNFSLAKYTLRKSRKYLKRFTILPVTIKVMLDFLLIKDAAKIMDLRLESLALMCSWSNAHHTGNVEASMLPARHHSANWDGKRLLVVDDTGGLVVAALADKMGILHKPASSRQSEGSRHTPEMDGAMEIEYEASSKSNKDKSRLSPTVYQSAASNTLTMVHPYTQPNLALLKYWGFVAEDTSFHSPSSSSPLYTHVKTLSWLQLLEPEADTLYAERPPELDTKSLQTMKSARRSQHLKKVRRWQRVKNVVDETRAGGFDGLVVASFMHPQEILKHLVPLLRGGAQVVVYSPNVETVSQLADLYSKDRRAAYLEILHNGNRGDIVEIDEDDFPLNPTLLLNASVQTARAVDWQVLPGRTHPQMTSRGGPEGYIFTATRVIPNDRKIDARGKFSKKRKGPSDREASTANTPRAESEVTPASERVEPKRTKIVSARELEA